MRAVVDTNILIRALIKPNGTVGPVLSRLALGEYVLIYSEPLVDELVEKLALPRIRNKYSIDDDVVEGVLQLIALRAEPVTPARRVTICRDPDDNRVLEAAHAGQADFIVSGDADLLDLKSFEKIPIVTPFVFLLALDRAQSDHDA